MAGGGSQPSMALPYSFRQWPYQSNQSINQSINLPSLHKTVLNGMVTCTARTPLPTLGAAMSTFMMYRVPKTTFKSSQWIRKLIQTSQENTYSQWIAHSTFCSWVAHSSARAIHMLSLMTQSTEAYNNSSSIPIDKLSFTFGIPLTLPVRANHYYHGSMAPSVSS